MLIPPSIILSLVLASLYAAIFVFFWAKRSRRAMLYWVVAWAGFGLGQLVATAMSLRIWSIGQVEVMLGTIACWIAMSIAKWLKL